MYFTSHSGNVVDDTTHVATGDLLCQLVGGPEFLSVADCKLASQENLGHIARRGERVITVMPRSARPVGLERVYSWPVCLLGVFRSLA